MYMKISYLPILLKEFSGAAASVDGVASLARPLARPLFVRPQSDDSTPARIHILHVRSCLMRGGEIDELGIMSHGYDKSG